MTAVTVTSSTLPLAHPGPQAQALSVQDDCPSHRRRATFPGVPISKDDGEWFDENLNPIDPLTWATAVGPFVLIPHDDDDTDSDDTDDDDVAPERFTLPFPDDLDEVLSAVPDGSVLIALSALDQDDED